MSKIVKIITTPEVSRKLRAKYGCSMSISYALNFKRNSLHSMQIRHEAFNVMSGSKLCGIYEPKL